ncbi:DgyrCDS5694 [Dimorphilus gyrociliatus]|uniref:Phosphodiesterase n=1 Tax=Dimorphilus gyrociliatus TaxID=2664684 RepID=A0A7I8VKT9_9ANNE|nr:DgyrCDS5694 [Dimorphilus gyrociliatus]
MTTSTDVQLEFNDDNDEEEEERAKVERYLDEHKSFAFDYLRRKFGKSAFDTAADSTSSSGANTPIRKISSQEFGGQTLRPMLTTVDGNPTFFPESMSPVTPKPRKTISELKALNEREILYELVMDICNDLDVTSLCHKILQNVSILVNADRCSLFLVQEEGGYLTSKLFDVNSKSTVADSTANTYEIRVSWGQGIIGHVAKTGNPLNIADAYEDSRFNREIDVKTGYKTRSILSMPIKDTEGHVIGVAQAVNKLGVKEEPFGERDEKVFASFLAFCGIGIRNAQLYERSVLENRRNQLLLDLARFIFEEQRDVATLIHKIMMHTQSLLRCERCQVLLIDDESSGVYSQVFDLQASSFENDGPQEARFPINVGITSYVASKGEIVNIPDAYKDERFDRKVDDETDFKTKSILCIPIKNAQDQVIGISQMVNKLDGTAFNKNDENLMEAFAIFCGMGIHNTHMYEKACKASARQRVALEVLSYHAQAPLEDVEKLHITDENFAPTSSELGLYDHNFSDFSLEDNDTIKASFRMFCELDLFEKFHIDYRIFCHWLLSVKKNYRNVIYHNWRHAFNVTHTMFWMMTQADLGNYFTDLEKLALFIGCLCHDLDHRGTNNQFQIKSMSPLAQLYSTSVMERHHFEHCIMILSTKGTDILSNLTSEKYEKVIKLLEHAILATDLAVYFKQRPEFFSLVDSSTINWESDKDKELVRAMMMTACDVSAITKPWNIQKKVASLIANEFFEQGDKEKELKITPIDMMNRDKKDMFPSLQVSFIDGVCMPVYEAFSKFNNKLAPLLKGCEANRQEWKKRKDNLTEDEQISKPPK